VSGATQRGRRDGERGFALLTVLVAILLLTVLVVQFHFEGRVELRLVTRQAELEQTRLAAASGVTLGRRLLEEDDSEVDALSDPWALPLEFDWEELHWSIQIEDEASKLGLGDLSELDAAEQERRGRELRRLTGLLGQSGSFADALLDWVDEDDLPRPGGAENLYYLALGYRCKNRGPDTVYELYRVRHALAARPEDRVQWEEYLSARPADEVNVNTAPLQVLLSLSDKLDRRLGEAILTQRSRRSFQRVQDLKTSVPGMEQMIYNELFDRLRVSSSRFRITSRAELRGTTSTVVAEVERDGSSTRLLYWSLR
jgi:general secretion pathway protein K